MLGALAPVLALVGTDEIGYVWAAYLAVIVTLITFAVLTMRRGRRLARQLPPEDRRWM